MTRPDERPQIDSGDSIAEPDRLDRAADLVLAVVAARQPAYPATAEAHDAMVNLLDSIVSALLVEGWPS